MKKISALFALLLALSLPMHAQDAPKDAAAIQQFLNLDKAKSQSVTSLLEYKYKIKNDPASSAAVKKKLPWMIEKKLEEILTPGDMKKLKANKELFAKVTE